MLCRLISRSVGKTAKSYYCLRYDCLSVRPHGTNRLPLEVCCEIWNLCFFSKSRQESSILLKYDTTIGHFTLRPIYIFNITHSVLLRKRSVSDQPCTETQNTHFMFNIFFPGNRVIYEIMWKNMVQPNMPQMTIYNNAHALCMLGN